MVELLPFTTLNDDFIFNAVIIDEENCRKFLELILNFTIKIIEGSRKEIIVDHPEY